MVQAVASLGPRRAGPRTASARPGCSWAIGLHRLPGRSALPRRREPGPAPSHGRRRRPAQAAGPASRRTRQRWRAPMPRSSGSRSRAVEDARSIATLGKERQGSGVLIGDDGLVPDDRLPDPRGRPRRPGRRRTAGACRRASSPTTWPRASAWCRHWHRSPLAPVRARRLVGGRRRRAAAGRERRRRGRPQHRADGVAARRSPATGSTTSRAPSSPRRRAPTTAAPRSSTPTASSSASARWSSATPRGNAAVPLRGNMFVPVDLLKPILPELLERGSSRGSRRAWLGLNCVEMAGPGARHAPVAPTARRKPRDCVPGDIVVAVDGTAVSDLASLYQDVLWRDARAERDVDARDPAQRRRRCACRCTRSTGCRRSAARPGV